MKVECNADIEKASKRIEELTAEISLALRTCKTEQEFELWKGEIEREGEEIHKAVMDYVERTLKDIDKE
jgi:hypothetical protein